MKAAFLSDLNHNRYGHLMNDMHNAFKMGRDEYPKTLTSVYDFAINWKGNTGSVTVPSNDVVAFVTDYIGQDGDVQATDGSVILTRGGKTVE